MSRAPDRLDVAWERKRKVHAWLQQHPASMMGAIGDAFPLEAYDTIRKMIHNLKRDGFISAHGKLNAMRYSAIGDNIDALREVARASLSASGTVSANRTNANRRRQQEAARRGHKPRTKRFVSQPAIIVDKPKPTFGMADAVNGRYVHNIDRKRAWENQRGQGAA